MKIALSSNDVENPEIPKTSFFSKWFLRIGQKNESSHQAAQVQEKSSLLSKLHQKFRSDSSVSVSDSSSSLTIQSQAQIANSFSKHWAYILLSVLFGTLFIFLALVSLPFLLIHPYKFSLLFAFGTICFLFSIALLRDPKEFIYSFLKFDKLVITSMYVLSVCGTFYFSLVSNSWIFSLLFAIMQVNCTPHSNIFTNYLLDC